MELKSLALGLSFTIGIFAIKSGAGLHYFISLKRSLKTKILLLLLYGLVYFFIFIISSLLLKRIDIIRYFDIIQTFLRSGMFIHVLMAGGLFVWGIKLLKGKDRRDKSLGWSALVVPCPVCITVIFLSEAFLLSLFPDSGHKAVLAAYMGFMVVVITMIMLMTLLSAKMDSTAESILGAVMLIMAVYFLLSVIVMPQFGDIEKIYGLAAYRSEKQAVNPRHCLFLYFSMLVLLSSGYWAMTRKIKRANHWT